MREEDTSARVLIAGCGYVGSALADRLVSSGHEVWGLRRDVAGLPRGVRPYAADLLRPESLEHLPRGLDFVFYTAAPDLGDTDGYRSAYIDGLSHLLSSLARQGEEPRRVIFTSSTGVYGQRTGEWVDEHSPTEPAPGSGRILLDAERLVCGSPFAATVVRLGGIYGPGRTRLIDQVRAGTARCPPGPPRWSNRIHRDDCAGALHHLMRIAEAETIYLGVDREPAPICDVLRWIAERIGASAPPVGEPSDAPGGRTGRRTNKRCSSERLTASGYEFDHPTFREGFASLLAAADGVDERDPSGADGAASRPPNLLVRHRSPP